MRVYLGIYEGLVLAGVHEVRNFWHSVVECHAVYDPGFRGEYALQGHRLFCKWLLENSPFLNSITMVPDTTKYGRAIIRLLGATRVGHLDDAYIRCGKPVGVTLYQLTRQQYKGIQRMLITHIAHKHLNRAVYEKGGDGGASKAQAKAQQQAIDLQREQWNTVMNNLKPYAEVGLPALQQLQGLMTLEGQNKAANDFFGSGLYKTQADQARYQNLVSAEATGGLGSAATSNQLSSIAPMLYNNWLSGQMQNYGNLLNVGMNAASGQATAGQNYANNTGQLLQGAWRYSCRSGAAAIQSCAWYWWGSIRRFSGCATWFRCSWNRNCGRRYWWWAYWSCWGLGF